MLLIYPFSGPAARRASHSAATETKVPEDDHVQIAHFSSDLAICEVSRNHAFATFKVAGFQSCHSRALQHYNVLHMVVFPNRLDCFRKHFLLVMLNSIAIDCCQTHF